MPIAQVTGREKFNFKIYFQGVPFLCVPSIGLTNLPGRTLLTDKFQSWESQKLENKLIILFQWKCFILLLLLPRNRAWLGHYWNDYYCYNILSIEANNLIGKLQIYWKFWSFCSQLQLFIQINFFCVIDMTLVLRIIQCRKLSFVKFLKLNFLQIC